jgi:AP-3 complex subunit delta
VLAILAIKMFEKSLVDLIRGLRSHKGSENEYIQGALRECRTEIRSQDMDVKATALLKLIYLEMFGHDMSWASFNVLEVMSSNKHMQKRVGYLGAVQSFRTDTEVLMLATNLLKKDLTSPSIPTMSLPLVTLPHIVTSSLALSLLTDLIPRLSHSQPAVRKKTIVTLYRLALVYPETLRVAWPKIKERLMDDQEDSSVTAAVINVVCELGWRRPHDFLPLAPRLFDLLIEGGNNWMSIKIIKLFAVLTPLEPRLVKKLVRPLTSLIKSTTAMSLLYECINGIIQGGILDGSDGSTEGDDVANLCIGKLRGMIVVEGDPNLKYVALLAFNKIAVSYPLLVSMQQDVIMSCLDDPDISIRFQALELVSRMVSSDNLQPIVSRLVQQLRTAPSCAAEDEPQSPVATRIEPTADPDDEELEEKLKPDKREVDMPPLPNDYRREVITRILDMSAHETYANIVDFEWYLDILVQLIRLVPPLVNARSGVHSQAFEKANDANISSRIGSQILDIAVRVKSLRSEATRAAESLILVSNRESLFPITGNGGEGVLQPAAWVVGEFPEFLASPRETLGSLIHPTSLSLPTQTLSSYLQAVPKIFSHISAAATVDNWNSSQITALSLLLARVINFYEQSATHPSLDVQERCVGYLELFRLAAEAFSSQGPSAAEPPLLVSSALPKLFDDWDLNPVSADAQKRVPIPDDLELDAPINANLLGLLQMSEGLSRRNPDYDEFDAYYNERGVPLAEKSLAPGAFEPSNEAPSSYQALEDPEVLARRKAERRAKNKDDPFYIPQEGDSSGTSTPFHDILSRSNGTALNVDDIPIIDLQIDEKEGEASAMLTELQREKKKRKSAKRFVIASDETIATEPASSRDSSKPGSFDPGNSFPGIRLARLKKNLLQVDSSGLRQLSLEQDSNGEGSEIERREAEEAEMAAAMQEVERLRLQMQRAAETTEVAEGVDDEGTIIKRKKKKRRPKSATDVGVTEYMGTGEPSVEGEVVRKKKKKKKRPIEEPTEEA